MTVGLTLRRLTRAALIVEGARDPGGLSLVSCAVQGFDYAGAMANHSEGSSRADDRELFNLLTGEAIRSWVQLEGTLWMIAASLLRVDQFRARIVMAFMSNGRAQRELLSNLARTYLDQELASKLQGYLKRISSLSRARNLLAHAPIYIDEDGRENSSAVDSFDPETGLIFKQTDFPPNRVKMLRDAARTLTAELMEFSMMKGARRSKSSSCGSRLR